MEDFSAFLTLEQLKTFAGQVAIVLTATRMVSSIVPRAPWIRLRVAAVLFGIVVHGAITWEPGLWLDPSLVLLTVVNGTIIALVAMKTAETLSEGVPMQQPSRPVAQPPVPTPPVVTTETVAAVVVTEKPVPTGWKRAKEEKG